MVTVFRVLRNAEHKIGGLESEKNYQFLSIVVLFITFSPFLDENRFDIGKWFKIFLIFHKKSPFLKKF